MKLPQLQRAPSAQYGAIRFALYAKWLRQHQTDAELKMWDILVKCCPRFRFRKQQPLFERIPDFFCRELRLVIEVDGNSHQTPIAKRRDAVANERYQENGFNILRVQNWHVMFTPEKVELIVVSLINILRHSDELQRGVRGRCVIVSFREDPNSFRLT
jgi:very-short-patch-repair endonuclease